MKRLLPLFCIFVVLFASAGVAAAEPPQPDQFIITGYTLLPFHYEVLPSGHTKLDLVARGGGDDAQYDGTCYALSGFLGVPSPLSCQQLCYFIGQSACGVTGYFSGAEFSFVEQGNADLNYDTFEGSGEGTNHGVMTITKPDGQAVIRFDGQADLQTVSGNWRVLSSSGSLAGLNGQGKYTGNAGLVFAVTFDGQFN